MALPPREMELRLGFEHDFKLAVVQPITLVEDRLANGQSKASPLFHKDEEPQPQSFALLENVK